MRKINAKLVAVYANDDQAEFPVEWQGKSIYTENGNAPDLYPLAVSGRGPVVERGVILLADEKVKSRVEYDGDKLVSVRGLGGLLSNKSMKERFPELAAKSPTKTVFTSGEKSR